MKLLTTMKTLTIALAASVTAAQAADVTLRFGHVGAPGSLFEASANAYAQCVADESNGTGWPNSFNQ